MPIGSGLGSSAASAVASVFAFNRMLNQPLAKEKILDFAIEGEKITSGGSVHLDNISACLYGGFVLIRSKNPADIISIPAPADLTFSIVHPQIEVKTAESRKMIRENLSLPKAITQWGNVAGVVAALFQKDYELLKRSMEDVIIEPIRAMLIPHYKSLKQLALEAGAYGFGISGSGPSVFAISKSRKEGLNIGQVLKEYLNSANIGNDLYVSAINKIGPKILDQISDIRYQI
jgi:homoserine kinase